MVDLECSIAIVGAGPAGAYMAMRLGKLFGSSVCLFEKEDQVGGRLWDVKVNPDSDTSPLIGLGGRRVLESQAIMLSLANELNITLQEPIPAAEFLFARGTYSFNKDAFVKQYPGLSVDLKLLNVTSAVAQLMKRLLHGPERKNIDSYPNLKSYIDSVIGYDGLKFLHDMTRFKSDYEYPINAKSYIDWLEEELRFECNNAYYPIGGMSSYVRNMVAKANGYGVRVFLSEKVRSIYKNTNSGYSLTTIKRIVRSKTIIVAVPPVHLRRMKGHIVRRITSQPQFTSILGVKVMTVTQWFDKV